VGTLLKRGEASAKELAQLTRAESRAMAETERAAQQSAQAAESAAQAAGLNVVREIPGKKGEWNAALNGPLQPNTAYVLANGHAYTTDALGRVVKAEGQLTLNTVDRNAYQQLLAGQAGGAGYDGGHLLAVRFGGAGEGINYVAQLSSMNRGAYRELERLWAKSIEAGSNVKVEISPIYSGASKVPDRIDVTYWIDGAIKKVPFKN
jgi:filamentous hemagglutinin